MNNDDFDENENLDNSSNYDEDSSKDSYFGQGGFYQVDKTQYAWGLIWDVPNSDYGNSRASLNKGKIKNQAREMAKSYDANLYLTTDKQFALGSSAHGHKAGMKTVAMSLIDRWSGDFIAVFAIEDFYYLLAVKDGIVIPGDNDIRVDSEDDARHFIEEKIADDEDSWGKIVAPEIFGINGSKEEDIDILLRSSRSKVKLLDATPKTFIRNIIIAVCACAVGYGAYYGYNTYTAYKERIEKEQRDIRLKEIALKNKMLAKENAANETWPYDNKPIGQYALIACENAMMQTPIILPGYSFESMVCNPSAGSVIVTFSETYGSFVTVVDSINLLTDMKPKVSHNGKKITVSYDYKQAFNRNFTKHNVFGNVEEEYSWLNRKFNLSKLNSYVTMSLSIPAKTPTDSKKGGTTGNETIDTKLSAMGVGKKDEFIDKVVFKNLTITVDSKYSPSDWLMFLTPLKSFVVDSVSYGLNPKNKSTGFSWGFTGHAYEGIWQSNIDDASLSKKEINAVPVGTVSNKKNNTPVLNKMNNINKTTIK